MIGPRVSPRSGCRSICLTASRHRMNGPRRSTAMMASKSAAVSSRGLECAPACAALLTRTSRAPVLATAWATGRSQSPGRDRPSAGADCPPLRRGWPGEPPFSLNGFPAPVPSQQSLWPARRPGPDERSASWPDRRDHRACVRDVHRRLPRGARQHLSHTEYQTAAPGRASIETANVAFTCATRLPGPRTWPPSGRTSSSTTPRRCGTCPATATWT